MKIQNVSLEDAIYDCRRQKYCVQKSDYFWITVLRKLYKHAQRDEGQPGLYEITSLLEESLYHSTNKFGILPRTAQLYIGVEQRNYDLVHNKLLENDSHPFMFLGNTLTRPWNIFPIWSGYHSDVRASPVGKVMNCLIW